MAKELDNAPDISKSDSALADKIGALYRAGVAYKRAQGYYDKWPEYQRFWESDQWPQPTRATRTFPRPSTNHFKEIIEAKISALVYEAPGIFYEPQEDTAQQSFDPNAAQLLTEVAKNQAARLKFEHLLEEGCRDSAVIGTGIWFFPWDNSIVGGGKTSQWVGDVRGYIIDPADFFPDDPTNPDIQSQPGITISERRPLSEVKEFYGKFAPGVVATLEGSMGTSDTQVYDQQKVEPSETKYVDVLHRWWKVKKDYDTTLNYAVVCQGKVIRREEGIYKHGLYPFAAFNWYPRKKCFFGQPEAADLINNQKEHNRLDGMMLLAAYNTAMPKMRYKEGVVDPRDLNNDPGAVIKNTGAVNDWGVDYLQPPNMPAYPVQMRDSLVTGMRESTGAHEAWQGQAPSKDLNASAIMALQEAAGVRIRSIQRRFYAAVEDIGRLWLAHWKEFYEEARLIRITGPDNQEGFAWFRGTDYADMEFDVQVKAGSGSPYSKALYMANLDKMLQGQVITPQEYLELVPEDVFPKAQELIAKRQALQQQQAMAQQQQMAAEQQAMGGPQSPQGMMGPQLPQGMMMGGGING